MANKLALATLLGGALATYASLTDTGRETVRSLYNVQELYPIADKIDQIYIPNTLPRKIPPITALAGLAALVADSKNDKKKE